MASCLKRVACSVDHGDIAAGDAVGVDLDKPFARHNGHHCLNGACGVQDNEAGSGSLQKAEIHASHMRGKGAYHCGIASMHA